MSEIQKDHTVNKIVMGATLAAAALTGAAAEAMNDSPQQEAHSQHETVIDITDTSEQVRPELSQAESLIPQQNNRVEVQNENPVTEQNITTTNETLQIISSPKGLPSLDFLLVPQIEAVKPIEHAEPPVVKVISHPAPEISTEPVVEEQPVDEKESLQSIEFHTIVPQEVSEIMEHRTVQVLGGCSGFTIEDKSGQAAGVATAKHCGLSDGYIHGNDGQTYLPVSRPLDIYSGSSADAMSIKGRLAHAYISAEDGSARDLAIGVLEGNNPQDVLNMYKQNSLSSSEMANLRQGDVMYLSGWPGDQDNNTGTRRRQEFAMTVLGSSEKPHTVNSQKYLWTAIESNADGAECSFGNSGGEAFVIQESVSSDGTKRLMPRSAGALAWFYDLAGDTWMADTPEYGAQMRAEFETMFGVALPDSITAICGFAYDTPSPENNGILVKTVESADLIPGYESPEAKMNKAAREHFMDPSTEKMIADGYFGIGGGKEGSLVLDRVYLYFNAQTGQVTVGSYSDEDEGNLRLATYSSLGEVQLYDRDATPGIEITSVTGLLTPDTATKSFIAADGTAGIGLARFINTADITSELYYLGIAEPGKLAAYPASQSYK